MFQRPAASNIFSRHVAPREIASSRTILPQLSEVSSVDRALYFFQFQAVLAGRGRPYEPNGTRAGLQLGRGAACEQMPRGGFWRGQNPEIPKSPAGVKG